MEQWFESVDRLGGGDLARYRISVLRDNSFIYRLLKNLFRRGLAKTLSEKDQAAALYITEPFYEQMEALGIENVSTGYIFLVDSKGRIRWSATGVPSGDQEVQGFLKALEKLC